MTSLFDDRRFPDALAQARAELRARLQASGESRDPTTGETAVLAAAASLMDDLNDRVARLDDSLRTPMLELLGLRPGAARAARTHVRFWFDRIDEPFVIAAGTQVAVDDGGPVFSTVAATRVVPTSVRYSEVRDGELLVGLGEPAGGTIVRLDGDGLTAGGRWHCWDGTDWLPCRVRELAATTVSLEVPPRHEFGDVGAAGGAGAAWLRRRGQQGRATPRSVSAATTVAATVPVVHARRIEDEPLGVSDGSPGQRFRLREPPTMVDGQQPVIETGLRGEWHGWTPVADFAGRTAADRHVVLNWATGDLRFPPAVREPDGTVRRYGAVPPAGALVRIRGYWVGGGASGNVGRGALRVLRSALPRTPARVENPYPASGGCDAESDSELWQRAPLALRTGGRAVTAADHEELARQAHPGVARARCVDTPGVVRVLVVPRPQPGRELHPTPDDLHAPPAVLVAVRDHLEPRRLLGARLSVEVPGYQGISVAARIVTGGDPRPVRAAAADAVSRLLHPLVGGDEGTGWEFGEPVSVPVIRKLLFGVTGVLDVHAVALHPVDLGTGARSAAQQTVALVATALPVPVDHEIEVVRSS